MNTFVLHPRLAADTLLVCDLALCQVLLMNDGRFPWLILVPRRPGLSELTDLDPSDSQQLWTEILGVSRALSQHCAPAKINVAALGNVVAQLHLHVVARYRTDACWPQPVWGNGPAHLYTEPQATARISALRDLLAAR